MRQSEDARHDHGGAHRPLERQQRGVLRPVPAGGCLPGARCGAGGRGGHLRHRTVCILPERRGFGKPLRCRSETCGLYRVTLLGGLVCAELFAPPGLFSGRDRANELPTVTHFWSCRLVFT